MKSELVTNTVRLLTGQLHEGQIETFDPYMLEPLVQPRNDISHKGDYGHALLVSGSYGMAGATILAARSCMRCGTGLLTISVPACNNNALQISVPSAMTIPDPCQTHITEIPPLDRYSAIGVGPGLGRHPDTVRALVILLRLAGRPMVIDADAINIISMNSQIAGLIPEDSILTPHIGELRRLTGCNGEWKELVQAAMDFARGHKCTVVMKGAPTLIISKEGKIVINTTGNPGMATAGSGDVLTGIITSLLAQGIPPLQAAVCGAYLHGLAGDIAAQELTQISMNSSDISDMLPQAWKNILHK